MTGLDLARGFYEDCGKPMLEKDFPELLPFLAIGFVGKGSEHFGYDDELSRDHDFEPGFCIFLPGEDVLDRRAEFLLERAYAKLPKEYAGIKRLRLSPVGGNRNGVIRTADFFSSAVGSPDGDLSVDAWLHIPEYALAEATNGIVFSDPYGEFSRIRNTLLNMPQDIRLKRLAGQLLIMAQAGQYNYARCIAHGEPAAAQLACAKFAESAMNAAFLLENRYMPFYKWSFRALREFDSPLAEKLEYLLYGNNSEPETASKKSDIIESVCASFIEKLRNAELTDAVGDELERHAYSVNDRINDCDIRTMHILTAV